MAWSLQYYQNTDSLYFRILKIYTIIYMRLKCFFRWFHRVFIWSGNYKMTKKDGRHIESVTFFEMKISKMVTEFKSIIGVPRDTHKRVFGLTQHPV